MNPARIVTVAAVLLLAACQKNTPAPQVPLQVRYSAASEWTVELIAVVPDDLAYHDKRGLYLIRNTRTEQQFIGLSGVGISEVGRHGCGKNCTTEDER